jgi:hypothetical protein
MNEGLSPVTPVVGAAGATYGWLGLPLSMWVTLATLTFIVLQIIVILPKVAATIRKLFTKERDVQSDNDSP